MTTENLQKLVDALGSYLTTSDDEERFMREHKLVTDKFTLSYAEEKDTVRLVSSFKVEGQLERAIALEIASKAGKWGVDVELDEHGHYVLEAEAEYVANAIGMVSGFAERYANTIEELARFAISLAEGDVRPYLAAR